MSVKRVGRIALFLALCSIAQAVSHAARASGIRGEPEAVAAAQSLLDRAGGATVWRQSLFEVTERLHLASGETAEVRVVRDLSRPARRLESVTPSRRLIEWISPEGGWTRRNGEVTIMSPEALAADMQGLRQEPYAIYHRIARDDPNLRVELRSGGALYVFEQDERLLCWFQIAANGVLLGWGNFWDGAINQHFYGPLGDFGDVNLPRFGVTTTGSYRFEYLGARLTDGELPMPATPEPAVSPE